VMFLLNEELVFSCGTRQTVQRTAKWETFAIVSTEICACSWVNLVSESNLCGVPETKIGLGRTH